MPQPSPWLAERQCAFLKTSARDHRETNRHAETLKDLFWPRAFRADVARLTRRVKVSFPISMRLGGPTRQGGFDDAKARGLDRCQATIGCRFRDRKSVV